MNTQPISNVIYESLIHGFNYNTIRLLLKIPNRQILTRENTDEFLVIHPYQIFLQPIANVVLATVSSIFYLSIFSVPICQYFSSTKICAMQMLLHQQH